MISMDQVDTIIHKLSKEHRNQSDELSQEVCGITYRVDIFTYGAKQTRYRHIDLDFDFGHFLELREEDALYQDIYQLCSLDTMTEDGEMEVTLYKRSRS